jgi:hypothetical protein
MMTLGLGGTTGAKDTYKQYEPALAAAGAYIGGTALSNLAGGAFGGGGEIMAGTGDISTGGNALAGLTGSSGMDFGWSDILSLGGDALDMYGQYQAGEAQQDALNAARQQSTAATNYAKGAYAPYAQAGTNALAGLMGMSEYDATQDPQYQRQLAEMGRVMDMRSAARGMSDSSADLKARAGMSNNLYGQAYNREYNRLADLLNVGRYGTTGSVNAALGQGNTMSNLALQGGQVQANQLAGLYGGGGDLLAAPGQWQLNQQLIQALNG